MRMQLTEMMKSMMGRGGVVVPVMFCASQDVNGHFISGVEASEVEPVWSV